MVAEIGREAYTGYTDADYLAEINQSLVSLGLDAIKAQKCREQMIVDIYLRSGITIESTHLQTLLVKIVSETLKDVRRATVAKEAPVPPQGAKIISIAPLLPKEAPYAVNFSAHPPSPPVGIAALRMAYGPNAEHFWD